MWRVWPSIGRFEALVPPSSWVGSPPRIRGDGVPSIFVLITKYCSIMNGGRKTKGSMPLCNDPLSRVTDESERGEPRAILKNQSCCFGCSIIGQQSESSVFCVNKDHITLGLLLGIVDS
jgi:hypothetical protein